MAKDQFIEISGLRYKLAPEHKIKTNDPSLPSYQMASLADNNDRLEFVLDMFIGKSRWVSPYEVKDVSKTENYLPQWSREPDDEYHKRVKRTLFHNFFAPAVKGFPGFLSGIQDTDKLYQGIRDNINDIDLQGNNLVSFLWQADLNVIRDGFCGILVDMPRIPRNEKGQKIVRTLADQKSIKIRPYLGLIDRRNILWVSSEYINGQIEIVEITIREYVDSGKRGENKICRYKTFYSDGSYKIEVLIDVDDEVLAVIVDEGVSDLKEVPIVLYSATDINPLEADPPLENVAEKNQAYYELYSEYREIIHKMNTPVPVRIGLMMPGGMNHADLPPMVFGANTGIDVPQGGDFKFAELNGNVLDTDRKELDSLELAMNQDSLRFLSGNTNDRTAAEVRLDSSQTQATLSGIATLKESAIQQVAEKWAGFYGKRDKGGYCTVNRDLLDMPLTEGEMNALSNLAAQNHISVITLLEILRQGKRLPKGVNPSQEIRRLEAQFKLRVKQQQQVLGQQKTLELKQTSNQKDNNNGNGNGKNQS